MSTLHVAYVGNFVPAHSTETHIARTIEQAGHHVIRLQEDAHTPADLTRRLDQLRADGTLDLFLFTRTWGETVTLDLLTQLTAWGIPTVSWHLDLYYGLTGSMVAGRPRQDGIGDDPFWRTDWVFSPDGSPEAAEFFAERGVNHRWLLPGVVEDECYLADVPLSRDVVFVGSRQYHSEYPYRPRLLDWLQDTYQDRFSWHGQPGSPVRGDGLNQLYASTRVVVGDSLLLPGKTRYCSDRRYETPGRGGLLVQPWIDGIDDGYTDGETTVYYQHGDFSDLKERIDRYLDDGSGREAIRVAGHEHTRTHHTYTQRLATVLGVLRTEGAVR
jgi:hypothetical protein